MAAKCKYPNWDFFLLRFLMWGGNWFKNKKTNKKMLNMACVFFDVSCGLWMAHECTCELCIQGPGWFGWSQFQFANASAMFCATMLKMSWTRSVEPQTLLSRSAWPYWHRYTRRRKRNTYHADVRYTTQTQRRIHWLTEFQTAASASCRDNIEEDNDDDDNMCIF